MTANKKFSKPRIDFGKRLEAIRRVTGYDSAEAFAKELDLEGHTYRAYEAGRNWPDLDTLLKISDITGCSLDFLLRGKK